MTHKSNASSRASSPLAGAIGLALATAAVSAPAADTPSRLSTIRVQEGAIAEVSSSKFTSPLSETPQTIAIVPKEIFNQQGAQDLTDVLFNTPGITFNAGENGFATGMSNFSMRGFDTSGSVFIDGVRDSGNYNRDVFNLEQVEIVKGPSGDNGRGAASGYVNLATKTPHQGNALSISASAGLDEYDGDEYYRAAFDGNHAFTDSTALRLNLMVQDGGVPGREVAEKSTWGFAPSLAFGLGSDTRLVVAFQHLQQNDVPDWGVPGAFVKDTINYDPALNAEKLRDTFYGLANDFDKVRSDSARAVIEHDFASGLTVSNQLRWGNTERRAAYTMATGYNAGTQAVTTQLQGYWRDNKSLSNLTDFTLTAGAHSLAFGVELNREESTARRYGTANNPGTGAPISVFNPDARRGSAVGALVAQQESEVRIDTIAGYLNDTIALSEQWDLTGGVRVEKYEVEIDSRDIGGGSQGPDGYDVSKTSVSGKLGVVYKPSQNASFYASAGVSALPPGSFLSNPDISRTGGNAFPGFESGMNSEDAKTQRSINYEIGTKLAFADNAVNTTAAVFRTERRNVAITGVDPTVTPAPAVARLGYGKQIVQGIELGINGQINPNWNIFGGVAYMDSERDHSAFLDEGRRLGSPNDYAPYTTTRGDELAFTPKLTGNLWTTYRFDAGLTLGGGVRHVGSSFVGRPDDAERIIPNGKAGKLPSYTVADVVVSYDFNDALTLRLNARNITDELYAISSNWNASRVTLGEARSFVLSADYRF